MPASGYLTTQHSPNASVGASLNSLQVNAGLTFVSIPDTHPDTLPEANKDLCLMMRSEVKHITAQLANDPLHSYPNAIPIDFTTMQ